MIKKDAAVVDTRCEIFSISFFKVASQPVPKKMIKADTPEDMKQSQWCPLHRELSPTAEKYFSGCSSRNTNTTNNMDSLNRKDALDDNSGATNVLLLSPNEIHY